MRRVLFTDIQGFCKALSISARGSRAELESRLFQYKTTVIQLKEFLIPVRQQLQNDAKVASAARIVEVAFHGLTRTRCPHTKVMRRSVVQIHYQTRGIDLSEHQQQLSDHTELIQE